MQYSSDRLQEFSTYAFAELNALKKEIAKTRRVIDMGVGDPDFAPPKEIQGALVVSLSDTEIHRYPSYQGDISFRNSIARFFLNRYKIKLNPDINIAALIGTKEGIFHLPLALLNSGDISAYTDPGYPVYRAGIAFAGACPIAIPIREENDFILALDKIPDGIKLLWVNYPNNPTSAVVTKDFWRELVEIAHKRGFIIANDAAYSEIYFDKPPHSLLEIPGALDVACEFHSLSKTFCMTGWRIGFIAGNEKVISSLMTVKRYLDSGVFRAVQNAGKAGLDNYWAVSQDIRDIYAQRVQKWLDALYKAGIESMNYGTTFYIWSKIPERFESSVDFCVFLLERTGIVALPGSAMGPAGKGFVRFSMTLPDSHIDAAIVELEKIAL